MKMIVGLGNPGKNYARSKHNIGWMALDQFASRQRLTPARLRHEAMISELNFSGERVLLVKPMTYMNASGRAVRAVADYYKIAPEDIFVVVDDIDLPFGQVRIRKSGGPGTHNGMRDLVYQLKTEAFGRLRLGIGDERKGELADYVLGDFPKALKPELDKLLDRAADAIEDYLKSGIEYSMNRNNG